MTITINRRHSISLLVARLALGLVVGAHGAQKLFGWFGGFGFEGTMGFFTESIGLPYLLSLTIIILESVGMIALMAGLLTRVISASLIIIMIGAIFSTHLDNGFFMNWMGSQSGEGYEFHLLAIALSAVLTINGAGVYSFDYLLFRNQKVAQTLA